MSRKFNQMENDCCDCIHDDKSPNEDPCYQCLSGYYGRPNFERKVKEKKPRHIDEYTPLPWVQPDSENKRKSLIQP